LWFLLSPLLEKSSWKICDFWSFPPFYDPKQVPVVLFFFASYPLFLSPLSFLSGWA
jgi:hypothetical protein